MAVDFFLYQVNRRWYRLYWIIAALWNLGIFGLFIGAQFFTRLDIQASLYHVTKIAFVLSCINLCYLFIIYWVVQRLSLPLATLVASMFVSLGVLFGLANLDGPQSLAYIGMWAISTFFIGIYGIPLLLGSAFISLVYVALDINFQFSIVETYHYIFLATEVLAALVSYLFWKRRFMSIQEQQVTQLTGKLESNEQQSGVLIQSIADGVIVTNTDGKITLMNPAAAVMTEWPLADAMNVDATLVVKLSRENGEDLPAEDNPFTQVLRKKEHSAQTLQLTGRDEKKLIISLVVSPVTLPDSQELAGAVAVMRDISEERAAEKQRADFISTASHEMRTPVAAIEGYLALALNEKVSTIDSRARGYLDKAHTSTQHLGKLFQDLLTSSKAEDGRLSNHPTVVEMGAFLQQLTDDLKFSAEKKGLFAEFLIGASNEAIDATNKDSVSTHVLKPLYYVYADPDRMREVITNLFDNACKYTESGKISIGLTGDQEVVQMYVKDTGDGIPAEDIPHLFQKFYRVDNSATRTIGGTGLGLFICRKIVELYHGRIWVESEIGKGSTFFINLPRVTTQRAQQLQATEAATPQTTSPASTSVKA